MNYSKRRWPRYYALLLGIIVLLVSNLLSLKQFTVWPQILNVYSFTNGKIDSDVDHDKAFFLRRISHPVHLPRVILMYPVMKTARILKINPDSVFSMIVLAIYAVSVYLLNKIMRETPGDKSYTLMLISLSVLLVFFQMNGRMTFAFLSSVLFIWMVANIKHILNSYVILPALFILLLLFSSVSSGSYIVIYSLLLIYTGYLWHFGYLRNRQDLIYTLLFVLAVGFLLFFDMVYKVIMFYGGWEHIGDILNHGVGKYPVILAGIILAALYLLIKIYRRYRLEQLKLFVGLSIVAGSLSLIVGVSAFIVAIPGIILLITSRFEYFVTNYFANGKKSSA